MSKELREHIDARFDKVESKLDSFGEQSVKNATDITWIKGHVKIVTTLAITIIGGILIAFLT